MSNKIKWLLPALILAALVVTYYCPQWTRPLPLQVEEIDFSEPEPFKSKEECYKAAESYLNGCIRREGNRAACIFEQYCDGRGCC